MNSHQFNLTNFKQDPSFNITKNTLLLCQNIKTSIHYPKYESFSIIDASIGTKRKIDIDYFNNIEL
jgi:hypothetical protein